MGSATVNNLIEEFMRLSLDDKEYAAELIHKQLIEVKRDVIAKNAKKAVTAFRKKIARSGTLEEFYKDMESD
jgi:hypothetical protein